MQFSFVNKYCCTNVIDNTVLIMFTIVNYQLLKNHWLNPI